MNRNRWAKAMLEKHPDWEVTLTKGQHLRWKHLHTKAVVITSGTPSDKRALRNIESMLTRVERGGRP